MSKNNYFGLSLSDRLNLAGTSNQFSQALRSGNKPLMSRLLKEIDYSNDSAQATINTFLNKSGSLK